MSDKTSILFLSTDDSIHSQMAAAFATSFAGHLLEPRAAGLDPAEAVHPYAAKVMHEDWLDISQETPRAVTPEMVAEADLVITLTEAAQERCPALPDHVEHRHWPIEDPTQVAGSEQEMTNAFRRVQDEIKEQILFLMNEVRGTIDEF